MSSESATIQSLKAVDAWIDVINANINGGVRTAFKTSRLKFSGTNTNVSRTGNATSLPLQFPEPGLTTSNTVIDFSQGAITSSTETTHLAIQGNGFFVLSNPANITNSGSHISLNSITYVTRDGEFHTNKDGLLVNANGYFLTACSLTAANLFLGSDIRAVYNDLDLTVVAPALTQAVRLSEFLSNTTFVTSAAGTALVFISTPQALVKITGQQNMQYSQYGSTVFDIGYNNVTGGTSPSIKVSGATTSDATILSKSLEASNASMTQSVPELSLAQKLFSALTKVLQISQTNTDSVLNLVR
jgi:flagellar hook protein FlgE